MRQFVLAIVLGCLFVSVDLSAADWPQFLGPQRNGISAEKGLLDEWPAKGPKEVWRVPGGVGNSAISVSQGTAVTMVQRGGRQWLVALDAKTGKQKWEADLAPLYKNQMGDGPRGTPTIVDQEIFALTGEGILASVSLVDGSVLWSVNALKELRGAVTDYGMASSPLVVKDKVIVNLGAPDTAVAAFDRKSGKRAWTAGSGLAGYSSPTLLKVGGQEQVVSFTGEAAQGLTPETGAVLWSYPFETDFGCNIAVPLAWQDKVFISSGENHGSALLALKPKGKGFEVDEVWSSFGPKSSMRNEWQTSIVLGEHLYGFDNVGGAGPVSHLACIELATGKNVWQQTRYGKGNMIWADGKVFLATLNGELVAAKLSPKGYEELGRSQVVAKTRQAPTLADGLLYLRDDKEIVCLDVRKP